MATFSGQFSPGKIDRKFLHQNFTTFFTLKFTMTKEICHLVLTLGAISRRDLALKKVVTVSLVTNHEKSSKTSEKSRSILRCKVRDEDSKISGNLRSATWWTFRPRKKIFRPPPPKTPIRRRPFGPPAKPPLLLGFSIQKRSFLVFWGYFFGISRYFQGKFWESRISGRGVFFPVFFVEIPGRAISGLCSRRGRSQISGNLRSATFMS